MKSMEERRHQVMVVQPDGGMRSKAVMKKKGRDSLASQLAGF